MRPIILVVAATEAEVRGALGIPDVAICTCGVGPVDAGINVARWLAQNPKPAKIVHLGIAGCSRASGLAIGDVVVGTSAVYADTTSRLIHRACTPDAQLLARVRNIIPEASAREIATSAEVGGGAAEVEAMEGFAVLRAAEVAGVAAVEVRVISNFVEDEDRSLWRFDEALSKLAQLTPGLVAEV